MVYAVLKTEVNDVQRVMMRDYRAVKLSVIWTDGNDVVVVAVDKNAHHGLFDYQNHPWENPLFL